MYEVVRLMVCQSLRKKKFQGNVKGLFLKNKIGDFLKSRNMIFFF